MPRLLNFRALCARCERAEARVWCVRERRPLCNACARGGAVPIAARTVVTAMCSMCSSKPASMLGVGSGTPLCHTCAERGGEEVVALKEPGAAHDMVFDRMDFSGMQTGADASDCGDARVDMSYYQTKVPAALVGHRKRSGDGRVKSSSPSQRKR